MRQASVAIPLLFTVMVAAIVGAPINDLPAPIVTRQSVFSIPFTVPAINAGQKPAEVRLFASGDRGASWQAAERVDLRTAALPYKGAFTFRALADGEYWFAIRTVGQTGQLPQNQIGAPELRVVVDTRPPRLDVTATRGTAGEIVVRWQLIDPNLKPDSLRLTYQSTASPRWQPIAFDSAVDGDRSALANSATFWPADAGGVVTVRAEASDVAGNVGISQAQLELHQNAEPARRSEGDRPPLTASIRSAAPQNGNAEASRGNSHPPDLEPAFARGAPWPADTRTDLPLGRGDRPGRAGGSPDDARRSNEAPLEGPALSPTADGRIRASGQSPQREHAAGPASEARMHSAEGANLLNDAAAVHPPIGSNYMPPSSARDGQNPAAAANSGSAIYFDRSAARETQRGAASPRTTRASSFDFVLPPGEHLRMVNSTSFELAYDVDSIGRSGIAKVELWVSRDGGRAWTSMGVDSDNRSPFVTSVEDEGVYGYRISVQSGSGLGGRPPQPGDVPELWIGVDLTRPAARLISAEPGAGDRAGEILIRYEANDALLASRPVALLQSGKPGGPWTTIAAGLDNTGTYSWRFDNNVPDRVYLRLEVRDEAGNIGVFESADPISLERVLPQGRLRSVRPVGDSARGGPAAAYWHR